MKILLVGSGGREHALAKKLYDSPKCEKLYAIPGNPGIQSIAEIPSVKNDNLSIVTWARDNKIDMIVCGPEVPLVEGLADLALEYNIPTFGPYQRGAMLEGSKIFSKRFMSKYNIPTAPFLVFEEYKTAKDYIEKLNKYPTVIKASGLAAGKGVVIPADKNEALQTLDDFFIKKKLGQAGEKIVIEEFMPGEEMSIFYLCDGDNFVRLIAAKDYKRAFDGDKGGNTGGMGCYAPHSSLTHELLAEIETNIMSKIKEGFKQEKFDYRGVLYVGLMITPQGPKVVEFNCRFGDPETQVIMPLLDDDLAEVFYEAATGNLKRKSFKWKKEFAASVVIASGGYPEEYKKGIKINFDTSYTDYIHAGTKYSGDEITTNGGRVLNAVATGQTKEEALKKAYELAGKVKFEGSFYRKDIGR